MTHTADSPPATAMMRFVVRFSVLFLDQDPFRQLKDLSLLKDQLDNIQRRVEDEVGVGIPQVLDVGLEMFGKLRNGLFFTYYDR